MKVTATTCGRMTLALPEACSFNGPFSNLLFSGVILLKLFMSDVKHSFYWFLFIYFFQERNDSLFIWAVLITGLLWINED